MEMLLSQAGISSVHADRVRRHVLSELVCLGRHTVTGLITTFGGQLNDWTADYRLYSHGRFDQGCIFDAVRRGVLSYLPADAPAVVAVDDTRLRRAGRKVPGVKWTRDPLGPPFHLNLIRAQRCLQVSMALPLDNEAVRMVPVDFIQSPWPVKDDPGAVPKLPRQAAERLERLRSAMDGDGQRQRNLLACVDGGFTNAGLLKRLPQRTDLIGRLRSDAKLFETPPMYSGHGRRRVYGATLPTPEDVRKDQNIPWMHVKAFATGKWHQFKVKTISPVRWRGAGARNLRLIVIAPLAYRPSRGSRVLYRKPAYLICTDTEAPLEKMLQAYIWRWDIEVNFREEKSLLGVGQAKVRDELSAAHVPAMQVASYGLLLTAAGECLRGSGLPDVLPRPKWDRRKPTRPSTQKLINRLRHELWHEALSLTDFATYAHPDTKCQKLRLPPEMAPFYVVETG